MMLSPYFHRDEFACQCGCGFNTVDVQLLRLLEMIRERFGPVTITSGCRCELHNASVGGSKFSQHKLGRAADIQVKGVPPLDVQQFFDERFPNAFGMGRYSSFTHIDSRDLYSRWSG